VTRCQVEGIVYFPMDVPSFVLGSHSGANGEDTELYRNVHALMSLCQKALSKGVQAFVLCVNQSVNIPLSKCKQGMSPKEIADILYCKRCSTPPRCSARRGVHQYQLQDCDAVRYNRPVESAHLLFVVVLRDVRCRVSVDFPTPSLLFCERSMQDLHLKCTGTQGKPVHCSIVRCCGQVFGETGDALDMALQQNGVVL
jgi:hypothetical protein